MPSPFKAQLTVPGATRELIENIGKSSYLAIVTSFWYEYSLAIPLNYGIDVINRIVTFWMKARPGSPLRRGRK
jgi:hypothetical protein